MEDVLIFAIPVLALAIGLVAVIKMPRRMFGGGSRTSSLEERVQALEEEVGGLRALEQDIGTLRQELGETQERLDFAERLLARTDEGRRLDRKP
jgi:hypothetical protein